MINVLVTGAKGFIGKNLVTALKRRDDVILKTICHNDSFEMLESTIIDADVVYHLAGVNRPKSFEEYNVENIDFTLKILDHLNRHHLTPKIIFPSSIQVNLDNPYGNSKKKVEEALLNYAKDNNASVAIYRLPNVFGKWSKPNYNTVVATFCYNIARDLDVVLSDPCRELGFVYIDDVVTAFMRHLDQEYGLGQQWYNVDRVFRITLGDLAERIKRLHTARMSLEMPDLADELMRRLHATYSSFLPENEFAYPVDLKVDVRGMLFELIKSSNFGQIFVSKTMPGVTRGNHYHDSKVEKFCVIHGMAIIRMRHLHSETILEYPVTGNEIKVVDIPPGYTHSIENVGETELICLFWANQIFSPELPDTYWEQVQI